MRREGPSFQHSTYNNNGADVSRFDRDTFCPLEIGSRGDFTPERAQAAATVFKQLAGWVGPGCISTYIIGFDADPRELWDVPEAVEYMRSFSRVAGIDIDNIPEALDLPSLTLLSACGVLGPEAKASMWFPPKVSEQ